jgi:hypothetical protein
MLHPALRDSFYYHTLTDEDGFDWRSPEALLRYKEAWDGDHRLTLFQCDLCWFQNLQHRDPHPDLPKDMLLLCAL